MTPEEVEDGKWPRRAIFDALWGAKQLASSLLLYSMVFGLFLIAVLNGSWIVAVLLGLGVIAGIASLGLSVSLTLLSERIAMGEEFRQELLNIMNLAQGRAPTTYVPFPTSPPFDQDNPLGN